MDTFTGIDLVAFRSPSPSTIPPAEFERMQGEPYEWIVGEGEALREAVRADDEELARELRGDRNVAVLVLAVALAGLVTTLVRPRLLFVVAGSGTAILFLGLAEAANPAAILESPPTADHLVGWWVVLGLFPTLFLAELGVRARGRAAPGPSS